MIYYQIKGIYLKFSPSISIYIIIYFMFRFSHDIHVLLAHFILMISTNCGHIVLHILIGQSCLKKGDTATCVTPFPRVLSSHCNKIANEKVNVKKLKSLKMHLMIVSSLEINSPYIN